MRKKIGDILLAAGLISEKQLSEALDIQKKTGNRLGKILVDLEFLTDEKLSQVLSEQLNIPTINLSETQIDSGIMSLLPKKFLEERLVMPVRLENNSLQLAMVDPLDYVTIKDTQFLTGKSVKPLITTSSAFDRFLKDNTGESTDMRQALESIRPTDNIEIMDSTVEEEEDILMLRKAGEAAPIISMVNMILSEAVKAEASDIHIEPRQKDLLVRYRIDGLLRDMTTLPAYVHMSIISRIKIMAKMDISIRRRPQDGGTKIKMGNKEIDLRISTLPTLFGEKMVVRILDKTRQIMNLPDLGLAPEDLMNYRSFLTRPQGMVLVTGPTGSGKTTTLYASLLQVRSEGVNIITIEDPVEYQISGVNQVHVNEKAGITFATGLRSLLRQDPNILMVGEIRDRETAEIAFQSTLTGHLVLSTLHTNNSIAAVTRLVDIGIEPYIIASSLVGVVAQRLVRRNCPYCVEKYNPAPAIFEKLHIDPKGSGMTFYMGKGCDKCNFVGYRGRIGIYEIFSVNDLTRELIINRASEKKILTAAREGGMTTMEEDGIRKALHKITTPDEILRVIPPEEIGNKQTGAKAGLAGSRNRKPASRRIEPQQAGIGSAILVEGVKDNLKELAGLLCEEGYNSIVASNGQEVIQLLKKHPDAIVISNVLLDDTDIGELEKLVRENSKTKEVPILAVPKAKKSLDFMKGFGFDKDRVITRPFKIGDIRKKIAGLHK